MTPTITLTTDFGHKGPFVAVVKGVILKHAPTAHVIDLTHEIHVHWTAEAGFWLSRAYHYFPIGSIHVAVVDPGVGTERDIHVAESNGHVFMAPDNGILPLVLNETGDATLFKVSMDWVGTARLAAAKQYVSWQGHICPASRRACRRARAAQRSRSSGIPE